MISNKEYMRLAWNDLSFSCACLSEATSEQNLEHWVWSELCPAHQDTTEDSLSLHSLTCGMGKTIPDSSLQRPGMRQKMCAPMRT
jgi:hypothetical protein